MATERKRVSTPKPSKATIAEKPKVPDHPCMKQMERTISAIRRQHDSILHAVSLLQEISLRSYDRDAALTEVTRESREGKVQVLGELEQIRTHLARFIDQEIRERVRDEQIDSQLAGINERLRERSKVDRVLYHGKMVTAEELARELKAAEHSSGEKLESAFAVTRQKEGEISGLQNEIVRLRSELEAARTTAATLESMAFDPLDRRPLPLPRKSWRTTVAENVTAAPLD
jgi:chromosome segregation ATPase